jgi:hypothetical protein
LPLKEPCERRLKAYTLAATTAGVATLALAGPAEAKVIYTPAHVLIGTTQGVQNYRLDLNHDGIGDATFGASFWAGQSSQAGYMRCVGLASNRVWGRGADDADLKPGFLVRSGTGFNAPDHSMALAYSVGQRLGYQGPWANGGKGVKDRYLGLKFAINGKTHYGWARLNVKVGYSNEVYINAVLTGYAYETVPNKPIITGKTKGPDVVTVKPASLAHLARGASARSAWRAQP